MVIADLTAHHLRLPRVESTFDGTQDILLVRIETDTGLVGWGEVVSASAVARAVIEAPRSGGGRHGLRELVIGLDPLDPPAVWDVMYEGTAWYGRGGVAIHAMAGVDVALWDIRAQAMGLPLYEALADWAGERPVDRANRGVRAYASVLWPDQPVEVEPLMDGLVDAGFTAVKLGWGSYGQDVETDRAFLEAASKKIGSGALMIDVGRRWGVQAAVEGCRLASAYDVEWVEEPLHPDDLSGYAELVGNVDVTIAAGETEDTLGACKAFLASGVQVLQPDLGRVGLTAGMKIARVAKSQGAICVPHCFGTGINTVASLHWMAAIGGPWLEVPMQPHPLCRQLVHGLPTLQGGHLSAPTSVGLGVDVCDDLLNRYRW